MQCVHDRLIAAPFWLVLIIAGLTCNGGTWIDTACLVTSVRNFPNERGTVVGLLKACVGEIPFTCLPPPVLPPPVSLPHLSFPLPCIWPLELVSRQNSVAKLTYSTLSSRLLLIDQAQGLKSQWLLRHQSSDTLHS